MAKIHITRHHVGNGNPQGLCGLTVDTERSRPSRDGATCGRCLRIQDERDRAEQEAAIEDQWFNERNTPR